VNAAGDALIADAKEQAAGEEVGEKSEKPA